MKPVRIDAELGNADWLKREWTYPRTWPALRRYLRDNYVRREDFRERPIVQRHLGQPGFEFLDHLWD
jgi:hypothetical protein